VEEVVEEEEAMEAEVGEEEAVLVVEEVAAVEVAEEEVEGEGEDEKIDKGKHHVF
jgi:hypothetical protein